MDTNKNLHLLKQIDIAAFGAEPAVFRPSAGFAAGLPAGFAVLRFGPTAESRLWRHVTCGLGDAAGAPPTELLLLSLDINSGLIDLLASASLRHRADAPLKSGSILDIGRPWWPGSSCAQFLLVPPHRQVPASKQLGSPDEGPQFLQLIPIFKDEAAFAAQHGPDALLARLAAVNIADPHRKSTL